MPLPSPPASSSFTIGPNTAGVESTDLPRVNLGIGAVHIAFDPATVWTVLGSCVAVILFAPAARMSCICHAQLPSPVRGDLRCRDACPQPCVLQGTPASELKYVTCSIEYMISQLEKNRISKPGLACAIIGGADLFKGLGPPVGKSNVETARRVLTGHRIPVQFEDVGGKRGRTLTYTTATGKIALRRTRDPSPPQRQA